MSGGHVFFGSAIAVVGGYDLNIDAVPSTVLSFIKLLSPYNVAVRHVLLLPFYRWRNRG